MFTKLLSLAAASLILLLNSTVNADENWHPIDTQTVGQHPPTPQESLRSLRVPDGFEVTLAASEPDVRQPIAIAFDDRGRLWVAESYSYDGSDFVETGRDRILILEDQDGDGTLETRTVFQSGLNRLTGLEIGFGGVFISAPPHVSWIPDRDGDDQPDGSPVVLLDGWSLKAEHNSVNGLTWGPDGWLYGRHGIKHPSLVGTPGTPQSERVPLSCCIWRYHPVRKTFEVVADGTVNPWGLDFDDYGQAFFSTSVVDHLWHLVPGAHYERRKGQDRHPDPFVYEAMEAACDHLHWGHQTGDKRERLSAGNDAFGGGHAHCDAMIYLGGRWPEEYHNHVFMSNIHGRRINQDSIESEEIGNLVARHQPDLLISDDPWFRAVSMEYGPDGDVYITDWSDLGECHDRDGIHRNSGRIYKLSWGTPQKTTVDLRTQSNLELARLQSHENEWYVRHARRLLQERTESGASMNAVHEELIQLMEESENTPRKLRALWALNATGGLSHPLILKRLKSDDHYIRAWAIRLLTDRPGDDLQAIDELTGLAETDPSWLVQIELASAAQRLPLSDRWAVGTGLAINKTLCPDANLERMIWYAIEPGVANDLPGALERALKPIPQRLRRFIARRTTDELNNRPEFVEQVISTINDAPSDELRVHMLMGVNDALLRSQPDVSSGTWELTLKHWVHEGTPAVQRAAAVTAILLGGDSLVETASSRLFDSSADKETRRKILESLISRRPQSLAATLHRFIESNQFLPIALSAAADVNDDKLRSLLLDRLPRFPPDLQRLALDAMISRESSASQLLQRIEDGQISAEIIAPQQARQIAAHGNPELTARLLRNWGAVNTTSESRQQQIRELRIQLRPEFLVDADAISGRKIFQEKCSVCHRLFGEGKQVAPDLTGAQRQNLDYLLLNIIDPNATVPADFQMSIIALDDGRVVSGSVVSSTDQILTVQTQNDQLYLERSRIEEIKTLSSSLMPEDLLKGMSIDQIRDLFHYIMSDGP